MKKLSGLGIIIEALSVTAFLFGVARAHAPSIIPKDFASVGSQSGIVNEGQPSGKDSQEFLVPIGVASIPTEIKTLGDNGSIGPGTFFAAQEISEGLLRLCRKAYTGTDTRAILAECMNAPSAWIRKSDLGKNGYLPIYGAVNVLSGKMTELDEPIFAMGSDLNDYRPSRLTLNGCTPVVLDPNNIVLLDIPGTRKALVDGSGENIVRTKDGAVVAHIKYGAIPLFPDPNDTTKYFISADGKYHILVAADRKWKLLPIGYADTSLSGNKTAVYDKDGQIIPYNVVDSQTYPIYANIQSLGLGCFPDGEKLTCLKYGSVEFTPVSSN